MSASQTKPVSTTPTDDVTESMISVQNDKRNTPAIRSPPKGLYTDKSPKPNTPAIRSPRRDISSHRSEIRTPTSNKKLDGTAQRSTLKRDRNGTKNRIKDINILIRAASEYLNILINHDFSLKKESRYTLWESWVEDGILGNPTLHMASVIVDFPPSESKSIKSLGEFIIHKLPPLSRYIYIPKLTRAHDPWLYLNEPIYGNNAPVLHSTIMTPSPHNREPTEAIHKSVADDKDKNSNAKGIEQNDNVETDVTIANVMNTATPSNDATTTNVVTASNKKDNTGIDITDKNVKSSNATADNPNIIITSEFNTVTQTTSDTSAASAVKESNAITMRKI